MPSYFTSTDTSQLLHNHFIPQKETFPQQQPTSSPIPGPSSGDPENPVIVVVNVPVQTVPVPVPVADQGSTMPGTQDTLDSDVLNGQSSIVDEDILDTHSPTVTPNPSSNSASPISNMLNPISTNSEIITSSPAPTELNGNVFIDAVQDAVDGSSGFTRKKSFQIQMSLTLLVACVIAIGMRSNFYGFFVAAIAVSSLFLRTGNSDNAHRNAFSSMDFAQRKLQDTCTYNVEILYDACTKNIEIDAPAARTIDVVVENFISETNAEDQCQNDYSANLTFPVSDSAEIDLSTNKTVSAYSYSDWQCLRAIEGRPFIDVSGKSIQAMPILTQTCLEDMEVKESTDRNATYLNQIALGNEWVSRALGEHSSIASFSVFSIALMTNAAPSSLVEDTLNAGLDEIRHAQVSFEIASKLLGNSVEPSFLPESKHAFVRDVTALALAVAREGCVDETMSAIVAAYEVSLIESVLKENVKSIKYANIGMDVLLWILDELKTISLDESNHSALAWRTLKWVCDIDSEACNMVKKQVFDSVKLEMRFQQRSDGDSVLAAAIKEQWEFIYHAFQESDKSMCNSQVEGSFDIMHFKTIAETVTRTILC